MRRNFYIYAVACFALLVSACTSADSRAPHELNPAPSVENSKDLEHIKERGKLIALTDNSSTSYFIYKGQPMGYEFELLQMYAAEHNLELEIRRAHDLNALFSELYTGEVDIVAANLTVTKKRAQVVDFTNAHLNTRQVLVQKLPVNWRNIPKHRTEKMIVRNPIDLIDQEVHVRRHSSFYDRLVHLSEEIGGDILIHEVPGDIETEQLINMVADGEIDYTVADENVAQLNKTYHQNIDISTPISFPQQIAWAVRKDSPNLKASLNAWIKKIRKTSEYANVYNKYFRSSKIQKQRATSLFSSSGGNHISSYDALIKKHAQVLGWDWTLLASQIYQESNFDPTAEAWTGAQGLMQLLPPTAVRYGVTDLTNPEENLRAATEHLIWLDDYWSKTIDRPERTKFVLASYNVGLGHIIDGRRLARKYGKDDMIWDDHVEEMVRLKAQPQYYNDVNVKHGYCRGSEPLKYVNEILERQRHYQKFIARDSLAL